ncbi:hypothetical protein WJX79_009589 [Trebouxia sp. C0005]
MRSPHAPDAGTCCAKKSCCSEKKDSAQGSSLSAVVEFCCKLGEDGKLRCLRVTGSPLVSKQDFLALSPEMEPLLAECCNFRNDGKLECSKICAVKPEPCEPASSRRTVAEQVTRPSCLERHFAKKIQSKCLASDATCSLACSLLGAVLFLGSILFLVHPATWWADAAAALLLSVFIAKEGIGMLRNACSASFEIGGCC